MGSFVWIKNVLGQKTLRFDKPGAYTVYFCNLSGKLIFDLRASGVTLTIRGLFVGRGNDDFVLETVQRHVAPYTTSDLLIKGVLFERSKFHYRGLIRIEKNAQKSHAYQKNQNLMMSPDVFIESKPFLEILAHEVFCTHGSTTGMLNKEHIHYFASRGISIEKAKQLLIKGFINDLIDTIRGKVPPDEIQKLYKSVEL